MRDPLTHRKVSSSFSVFTGGSNPNHEEPDYPWEAIAKTPVPKVLLMCVERLGALARGLMEHDMSSDTPSAMISWGTYGRQRSVTAPLEALAKKAQEARSQLSFHCGAGRGGSTARPDLLV